jgi:hypothetical protein
MDRRDKSQKVNCSLFQEKIFGLFDDNLPVNSNASVKMHMDSCQDCQTYLENLTHLKNQMQVAPTKDLYPNSKILKNIIVFKNIKSSLQKKNQDSVWDSIRTLFEFRIPVYQALSGAVVALMLFVFISNNIISSNTNTKQLGSSGNQTSITSSDLYVLDSLNLTNPAKGQNAKEDSVLISFLVPTM